MTDLDPNVRDRAIETALKAAGPVMGNLGLHEWRKVVDAVAAVVAPEIARPLQARIAELEGQLQRAESSGTGWVKAALQLGGNEERFQARVELLTAALTEIAAKNDLGCSGGCAEFSGWGKYYGQEHLDNRCGACVARAALAAGETESEAT